jgi:hypothetical protein
MRNLSVLKVIVLLVLAVSASIGYWKFTELYRIEETEILVQEKTYTDEVFAKGAISGLGGLVYKGWVSISLYASREVRVDFQEAIIHNGARYHTLETLITDRIANTTFDGPEYVAIEVGMLEDYDEVTVWSMKIVGPVELTYRPYGDIAVTIGYFSILAWFIVGSWIVLETVWKYVGIWSHGKGRSDEPV